MKFPLRQLLFCVGVLIWQIGSVFVDCRLAGSEAPGEASQAKKVSPQLIATWIQQLDSNEFSIREYASRQLLAAGLPAIMPLSKALNSNSLEVSHRSLAILWQMIKQNNTTLNQELEIAFENIVERNQDWQVSLAKSSLAQLYILNQDVNIKKLNELGADIDAYKINNTDIKKVHVYLQAGKWRGKDSDLALLTRLPGLYRVSVLGDSVGVGAIPAFCKITTNISQFNFYSCKISESDYEVLKKSFPKAFIDRRNGAFLGFQSGRNEDQCCLTVIFTGSAAEAADLRSQDVVKKIDDTEIHNFKESTDYLAKKFPGDKVAIQINRNGTTLTKEVTLGGWKFDTFREGAVNRNPFGVTPNFFPGKYTTEAEVKRANSTKYKQVSNETTPRHEPMSISTE